VRVQIRSFGQQAAANCAALPAANAGQDATSHCKPLLFWFLCKWRYIKVLTFNVCQNVDADRFSSTLLASQYDETTDY